MACPMRNKRTKEALVPFWALRCVSLYIYFFAFVACFDAQEGATFGVPLTMTSFLHFPCIGQLYEIIVLPYTQRNVRKRAHTCRLEPSLTLS